ncbi:MAG: 2-oxoacid:acceptor oxidoreductase subunit alpha [Betaproteobacteria bacterium]|nr:2-oxoacid:acceptor oxidoreductase subunit alpha [Betaproteobacteria bacterium]
MEQSLGAPQSVSLAIAGSGGAGVMTTGNLLLTAAARAGLYGLFVRTSGPQIRGGEAAALLRLSSVPVQNLGDRFDALIAIDWQNIHRFADEIPLDADSLIIGDMSQGPLPEAFVRTGARPQDLNLKELAKAIPGAWPNMVALGLCAGMLGLPVEATRSAVETSLKKASDRLPASLAAVEAGYAAAAKLPGAKVIGGEAGKKRWLITGNEAAGYGAVRGGVRFVAAYPITPATEVLEWLAPHLVEVGGVLVQAEDELASINMAIGASYGGTPSLTATAGPGLSLMIEALGLSVASETPIVVVDVMRGGPSTGIPAKSEQSDISIAVNGLHGDAPRIVVVPNSIADCLTTTQWAVHLAEKLQSPALVLSDQFLGQSLAVIDRPEDATYVAERLIAPAGGENYRRYKITDDGVSPMAIPGTPGLAYTADGLEHNEKGTPSSQATDHRVQLAKRERKLSLHDYGDYWADLEGEGELAVITLGSTTGPVREAIARAARDGVKVRLLAVRLLAPVRPEHFAKALDGAKRILVVEQNHSRQFYRYLRSEYDFPVPLSSFARPGPLPIRPDEVYRQLIEWSRA